MVDFLIVKRAIALSGDGRVTFGINDATFTSSVHDLMATTPDGHSGAPAPFINVFGTGSHKDHGYRQARYISNGTGVTVPRWDVVVQIAQRPAVVEFAPDYLDHLEELLLVAKRGAKPRLDDAACWYFRFTDLQTVSGTPGVPSPETVIEGFTDALEITEEERDLLFDESQDPEGATD